jgi:hypothetical protein
VLVEDVEVDGGHNRIAHGVLLVEEARVRARLDREPGAPFIHDQGNFLMRVVPVHDG